MRLVRSFQLAISIAAGSGVVLMLSGSAFAADGGAATTSQNSADLAQPVSLHVQELATSRTDSKIVTSGSKETLVAGQSSDTAKPGPSNSNGDAGAAAETPPEPRVDAGSAVGDSKVSEAAADTKAAESGLAAADFPQAVTGQAAVQAMVTITTPLETTGRTGDVPAVVHPAVLPIRPTITNHTSVAPSDLATAMPSVPAPTEAPVPAPESTGLLSNLTAQLAATVVPQPFVPHAVLAGRMGDGLRLAAVVVLSLPLLAYSYGLWLRRSGFATAARSDSGIPIYSYVATSLWLGYVRSSGTVQSPIFNDGRDKNSNEQIGCPNAFRKEEMS